MNDGYAAYRSRRRRDPHVAAVEARGNRTRNTALSRLARKYPAQYLALVQEVRREDPRPEPDQAEDEKAG